MPAATSPDLTTVIDQTVFLTPLGGPQHPISYLDRFPESLYGKGIDSHLVKFMYALLGPSGAGWLRKNYLDARLLLEEFGIDLFDLDDFYGDPLHFARTLEEVYDQDPSGLLPRDQWAAIQAKDAAYRGRALDFVSGARAGNTPDGIHLVARSGLGHECEIIENYRYIYDQLTDEPLGLTKFGVTNSTEEIVILPRRDLPQSEFQVLTIFGSPTGGHFNLFFPVGNEADNTTVDINYDASRTTVQTILGALDSIGAGNVAVTGGPLPDTPITIQFSGALGFKNVPQLQSISSLTGGTDPNISIETTQEGVDQVDEIAAIAPRDQRYLRNALERVKPVTTIVTYGQAGGLRSAQAPNSVLSSSAYREVVRFVTGKAGVLWPALDGVHWIESLVEHEAPKTSGDLQYHYRGFHNIVDINAYQEDALADSDYLTDDWATAKADYRNYHLGSFSQYQRTLYPILGDAESHDLIRYTPDQALADYAEPLTVSSVSNNSTQLINGIYPSDYARLSGVNQITYNTDQFYASVERTTGDDYLEIDLGSVQPVNYLYFEATRKPYDIEIDYDLLDLAPSRSWQPITLEPDLPSTTSIGYDVSSQNPWDPCEIWFTNSLGEMIYTRFLRIKFAKRNEANSPFTNIDGSFLPYSIEVRNLRAARNVS